METIGVSSFVREQIKKGGKSELFNISLEEVALAAEQKLNSGEFKNGYRDGVVIIEIADNQFCKNFVCPIVKIDQDTKLKCQLTKRRVKEKPYLQIKALNGNRLKTNLVEIILYRQDVLKETNENSTSSDWELIAFHAIPEGIDKLPMKPVTMMRNQLQLEGGTKAHYSSEEWAQAVNFWNKYALLSSTT
ncbi:MAG: hypothetical protein CMG11_00835 [Candidatus Marinimicrobia bacterium]|nr:hypothetical protein [Candidatus Neomarinimicrobiota bacterium]|tara:strand:- start:33083 stop:33652 length:570 start_codon:yes stop_codon:yes gene_type:complete